MVVSEVKSGQGDGIDPRVQDGKREENRGEVGEMKDGIDTYLEKAHQGAGKKNNVFVFPEEIRSMGRGERGGTDAVRNSQKAADKLQVEMTDEGESL